MFIFKIATIFPELFDTFAKTSLIGKAADKDLISIEPIDVRGFTHDKHLSVDDAPYGGGSGMVMKAAPIIELLEEVGPCRRILLTPQGRPFCQDDANRLKRQSPLLLFCGRYEGIDERARQMFDEEISIGDFVLFGGEVAAMVVVEAISRLVPGVLGNAGSVLEESFNGGVLEYPQYTRPETIEGKSVPKVLISGDHGLVAKWRRGQSLLRTRDRRPDLFEKLELSELDLECIALAEKEQE